MRGFFITSLVLAFITIVSAQTLTFTWPKYPEVNVQFPLTWMGGTPPYTVYVLTPDLTKYYYKYVGSDYSTTYDFPLDSGTKIAFQCRDSNSLIVTSPTITVISTLNLQYPSDPQTGVSSVIKWGGGVAPYTVYVLTPDQTKYYWKYTGSATSQNWVPDMDGGTQIVFQVIDLNDVKVTSDTVTVQSNSSLSTTAITTDTYFSTTHEGTDSTTSSPGGPDSTTSSPGGPGSTTSSPGGLPTNTGTTSGGGPASPTSSRRVSTTTSTQTSAGSPPGGGSGDSSNKGSSNVAAIAGGVAGGVVGLALIAFLAFLLMRRGGQGGAGMQDYGQGEKPTREPALPNVGSLDGEYAAGAAGIGGGVRGAGVGENLFTPEAPGGAYPGGAGGGFNNGAATGYAAGAGAGQHYQGQEQNQGGGGGYPAPGAAVNRGMTSPVAMPQPLPQNISYNTPQAASGFGQEPPSPTDPRRLSTFSGGGTGTSLPYAYSPAPHDMSGYTSSTAAGSGSGPGSPGPGKFVGPPPPQGWAGLPEVQS